MTSFARYESPLGGITLAGSGDALTGLWFDAQRPAGSPGREGAWLPVFDATFRWLDIYFSGKVPDFTPALDLAGTPFQREVWSLLLEIPYGCTVSYGEIAARVARRRGLRRMSSQAVGGAVGRNPVSLIVPCHRVIGADGSLVGYAGGLGLKSSLLRIEGVL